MKEELESGTGEHSGASNCSPYIPFVDIPEEIHAAAQTLHIYFEKQGMREWEFSYLADRRLVTKLERENARLMEALEKISKRHPGYGGSGDVARQALLNVSREQSQPGTRSAAE